VNNYRHKGTILSSIQQPRSPYIFITLQRQLVDFIKGESIVSTNKLTGIFFQKLRVKFMLDTASYMR
jgi:hypothetical protein